jgi:alpha-galactosidase
MKLLKFVTAAALGMLILNTVSAQKFEGLALTPPMGWNSWNHFACEVSEDLIKEIADAMVSSGMKDAGYEYINIDDCWHGQRDSLGFIHPDPKHFPNGMKALADYVHSKGLKLGIYSDAGWKTCGGHPGSRGYEFQDAMQYAAWGIDYLKYDWCETEALKAEGAYLTMRNALYAAGRPMVFSICEWGTDEPWVWGPKIGHLWRTSGDIFNAFDGELNHGTWSSWGVLQIIDMRDNDLIRKSAGPGHWNDPDMLEVGNGMTFIEDRAHFTMWAMLAAPLIAGNDLRNMSAETISILTHAGTIAVNQDSLGIQAYKHSTSDSVEVWVKPLKNDEFAICILNRAKTPRTLDFDWAKNNLNDTWTGRKADFMASTYNWANIWDTKVKGTTKKPVKVTLPSHDVFFMRVSPAKK